MASISIGGDPEGYMDAPRIQAGGQGKGGAGILASVLDAIGIGRQVAKEPKQKGGDSQAEASAPTTTQSVAPENPTVNLPILDTATSLFQSQNYMPSDWGARYLKSIQPITTVDPNTQY